ncbi:MAG: DNA polymerase III subunit delta' C-terminal domain-containing protein [Planctomycetota bacterium]
MLFENVIGQEPVIRIFENILKHQRLAHAYLFTGPMGVGKFYFARELAKTILCSTKNTAFSDNRSINFQLPCQSCSSCRQVEQEWHPNLSITSPAPGEKNITIDKIRRIEREIKLKPLQGKYKIFIINDAETIVEEGFNALLKTLEEPPSYVLLILITSKPEAILPTVVSRCQLIRFYPINDRLLNSFFSRHLKLPEKELDVLTYLARGSIGLGCYLKESDFLQQRELLLNCLADRGPSQMVQSGGYSTGGLAEEIISYAQSGKKKLEENRQQVVQQFTILALFFYDVLMLHYGLEQYLMNPDKKKLSQRIKSASSPEKIVRIMETLIDSERLLKLNANYKLVVENTVLNMNLS